MKELAEREEYDIQKVLNEKSYFSTLPEHHRTAAVSLVAVFASAHNLEDVPDAVMNRDICKMALNATDADCTVLPLIPYPEIQKKGIEKFSENTPAFVLYSFVDIQDEKMAREAVKADAYCLQLVPDKLITVDLCKVVLQHPDADKIVVEFIRERFRNNPEIAKMAEEKIGSNLAQKDTYQLPKKKNLSI